MRMITNNNEDQAVEIMRNRNRAVAAANARRPEWSVLVEGPADGEYTVMSLREAVDGGFAYSWEV